MIATHDRRFAAACGAEVHELADGRLGGGVVTPAELTLLIGAFLVLVGLIGWERSAGGGREVALVATLGAAAAAGRVLFAAIPSAQPVTTICACAGISPGPARGRRRRRHRGARVERVPRSGPVDALADALVGPGRCVGRIPAPVPRRSRAARRLRGDLGLRLRCDHGHLPARLVRSRLHVAGLRRHARPRHPVRRHPCRHERHPARHRRARPDPAPAPARPAPAASSSSPTPHRHEKPDPHPPAPRRPRRLPRRGRGHLRLTRGRLPGRASDLRRLPRRPHRHRLGRDRAARRQPPRRRQAGGHLPGTPVGGS